MLDGWPYKIGVIDLYNIFSVYVTREHDNWNTYPQNVHDLQFLVYYKYDVFRSEKHILITIILLEPWEILCSIPYSETTSKLDKRDINGKQHDIKFDVKQYV